MQVKFWGVRGSLPAPVNSDRIKDKIIRALELAKGVDLDDVTAIRDFVDSLPPEIRGTSGGNTSCVEINVAGKRLIMDAGSGLRELGLDYMKREFGVGQGNAHIFISHTHWDHIQGFPYFIPAYIPGNRFIIYSPKKDIEAKFAVQQIDQDMFPKRLDDMAGGKEFVTISGEGIDLGGVFVDCIVLHHPGGSWAYRIKAEGKTLIYATDGEYQDLSPDALQPYLDFYAGADAIIFDAMYTFSESVAKQGWGHSTSLIGVDIAVKTGIKKLILFHHEPTYDDRTLRNIVEKTAQYYSLVRERGNLEIVLAVEGDEFTV